jgi:hypothetical protein
LKSNHERKDLIAKRKPALSGIRVQQLILHSGEEEKNEGWDSLMDPWWDEDNMELPTA